ncbi:protein cramped-like [Aplochiton taeniatus]
MLQSHDQHHFLRSSVRPPSKRVRKDSSGSVINGFGSVKSKGLENGVPLEAAGQSAVTAGVQSRTNHRSQVPADKEEPGGNQKRARRQWESWSAEDKNSFFEGLYEHGKDFEAIQNNIAMKYKKKGKPSSMVKNKEQVRHFYYRTWHKISKYIDFSNVYSRVLKKSSQELYGLICYAELRKKVGGLMDDKNVAKLNELIQQGATTVRSKGRNLRIKAPMCRALKKICDPDGVSDDEDQKPVRLPLKVALELQPRSNHSWARVQCLAHNPRLRMVVELHRKVSSLIEFLKQKWAVQDQRILQSLQEREVYEGIQLDIASPFRPDQEDLFLYPAETSTLTTLPGVARVVHSKASCTVHWQETGKPRPGCKELPAAQILGIHTAPPPRGVGKTGRGAPAGVKYDTRSSDSPNPNPPPDSCLGAKQDNKPALEQPSMLPYFHLSLSPIQEASMADQVDEVKECAGLENNGGKFRTTSVEKRCGPGIGSTDQCRVEQITSDVDKTLTPQAQIVDSVDSTQQSNAPLETKEDFPGVVRNKATKRIREDGWNVRDSENVTLAELYLMQGKPGKLQLEYEWQPISSLSSEERTQSPPQTQRHPGPLTNTHRVLRCLLRLVSTEVHPKPVLELGSPVISPLKPPQEEQSHSLTPPGKSTVMGVRSPNCGRQQAFIRGTKLILPASGHTSNYLFSGVRNLPRSLLVPVTDSDSGVFAVPTTLPPNSSRHSRMFSPNKEAELAFRQQLDSINMQSDIFLSKQRKPRSRQLRKPLVVQRTLLPRTTGETPQHVCSFSILSNSSVAGTGSFRPIQTQLTSSSCPLLPGSVTSSQLASAIDLAAKSAGIIPGLPPLDSDTPGKDNSRLLNPEAKNGPPLPSPESQSNGDSVVLPPSVSSLLDISLPGPPEEALAPGEPHTHISDSIIELAINSAHYAEDTSLSPAKLNNSESSKLLPSSPVSPSRDWIPSPNHDPQWYPNDSSDSSLGCLLSSLVSPEKDTRTPLAPTGPSSGTALLAPSLLDCNSHDSFQSRGLPDVAEVDTQLACMMSESSVDYIARFNDLAQELSVTEHSIPPPGM